MSAKFKRYVLATLGSTVLMGLLALPAEAKPPASNPPPDNPNAGQPLKPSDGAVINGRLDEIQEQVDNLTDTGNQCTACHNATTVISSKDAQWSVSGHGKGEAFLYGGPRTGCAGCHSGGAFVQRMEDGVSPDLQPGDPSPSRQDCRTCHQIHKTYTTDDWAIEPFASDPVVLYAVNGTPVFGRDGDLGNLCASCHQPRRDFPEPNEANEITGISSHWGPHHGPQSAMLLGLVGAGAQGTAFGPHYNLQDNCVACHMGDDRSHSFDAQLATCQGCHGDVDNFDIDGVQTKTEQRLKVLGDELVALNLIDVNSPEGHPIVSSAPYNQAVALWNWLYVGHEDKSLGVHNPRYIEKLLDVACKSVGLDAYCGVN